MNASRWLAFLPAAVLAVAGVDGSSLSVHAADKDQNPEKEAADAVAKAERGLAVARQQLRSGSASIAEVDLAEIELFESRLRLASVRGKDEEFIPTLKQIVGVRERIVTRMVKQRPRTGETDANINGATRVLAETRLRLARAQGDDKEILRQLAKIVELTEKEFARLEALVERRAATRQELDAARSARDEARRRFAEARGE